MSRKLFRRLLSTSLYWRVLFGLVTCISLVLAGITALEVSYTQRQLTEQLLQRGQIQARILAQSSSLFLANQDTRGLSLLARTATAGDEFVYIAFFSDSGALLSADAADDAPPEAREPFTELLGQLGPGSTRAGRLRWSSDYLEIAEPIVYAYKPIGAVALRIGTRGLESERTGVLVRGIITALILIVVLNLALGMLLRQLIMLPLRRLSAATEQVAAGSWVLPAGQERADEFGQLARSFGRMVDILQSRELQLQQQIAAVKALNAELDTRVAERTRELNHMLLNQSQLLNQLQQMSTPVVPVAQGVIVIPLVGSLDSQRAGLLIQSVLRGVEQHRTRLVVLDITGVPVVDTHVAAVIRQAAGAVRLLGATMALVGIRPEVAQALVQLGSDLSEIRTYATLQVALQAGLVQTAGYG